VQVPKSIKKLHIVGVSFIAGVGFTMSIFIATLAFVDAPLYIASAKIGVLIGSVISGVTGATVLYIAGKKYHGKTAVG
jgi:NhaA family Na+:H+ antiporter